MRCSMATGNFQDRKYKVFSAVFVFWILTDWRYHLYLLLFWSNMLNYYYFSEGKCKCLFYLSYHSTSVLNDDCLWKYLGFIWLGHELESDVMQLPLPHHPLNHLFIDVLIYHSCCVIISSDDLRCRHFRPDAALHSCVVRVRGKIPIHRGATSSPIHNEGLSEHQCNLMIFFLYPVAKQPAPFLSEATASQKKRHVTGLRSGGMVAANAKPWGGFNHSLLSACWLSGGARTPHFQQHLRLD